MDLEASARLCSGRTPVDGERASCPEIVLDLLQWAAARLWDAHSVEQQTEHAHHRKQQVGHVQAVLVLQDGEDVSEHEGRQPADSHTQTRSHAPGSQWQHLWHQQPGDRAPSHGVS